jgi:hypothetical protein
MQDSTYPFTSVQIDFGQDDQRDGRTFWLATRKEVRLADHFISLPIPHVPGARTCGFVAHTPEGAVSVHILNEKERTALEECLRKEFDQ